MPVILIDTDRFAKVVGTITSLILSEVQETLLAQGEAMLLPERPLAAVAEVVEQTIIETVTVETEEPEGDDPTIDLFGEPVKKARKKINRYTKQKRRTPEHIKVWEIAKESGAPFYYFEHCENPGHLKRYTKNGSCVECTKLANADRKRNKMVAEEITASA